jgi:hypothetical protein
MDNMGGSNTSFQQVYTDEPRSYNRQAPVSTGKWVGIKFIKWIPAVGGIIYLVMLFIWAFGSDNQNETFRNWAKAELIMAAILVVFWVIMIVVFGAMVMNIYTNLNNGTLDPFMYY